VDLQEVIPACTAPKLRHSLDKRHALDVANRAAQLDYAHIRHLARIVDGYPRDPLDPVLDCIGNVRDDLDRLAQVRALAFLLNHVLVYLAGGDVVVAREGDVEVALVIAEIEVDFAAVGQDEDLAVPVQWSMGLPWLWWAEHALAGVHSPGVDIEVGVDLDRPAS
jgi:hypothetical protein